MLYMKKALNSIFLTRGSMRRRNLEAQAPRIKANSI